MNVENDDQPLGERDLAARSQLATSEGDNVQLGKGLNVFKTPISLY